MQFVVTLAFLCACLAVSSSSQDPDIVQVSGGAVLGVRDSTLGARYWKGIPFGESTAGANRFMPPVPRKAWTGTLNCTVFGPGCVSDHHGPDTAPIQSEDCLNINVYVPLNATRQSNGLLPVMVFIYGGGFDEGDNEGPFEMYDGSALARQHGVIVMAFNYRLGALGFAVTNEIKGNLALQDQVLALQWVNQNAAVFGGDNMQVTIFGESAGAMSVGLLLVNQKAKGLFQRAIMESNPTDLLFLNKSRAWEYGADFCKLVGCLSGVDKCDTQCLQQANLTVISKAWEKAAGNAIVFITANWGHIEDGFLEFIPTCCDEWVPSEIIPALDSGHFDSSIPVIVGTNTNEAETFIYDGVDFFLPMVAYEWAVDFVFGSFSKQIIDYYKQFHFVDGRDALSRVFTDYWFRCASEKFATNAVNRGADAYVYRFNHVLKDSYIFPEFGLPKICVTEVCHASELPLVFRKTAVPAVNFTMTPEEVQLSDVMGTFWTNFAKTGNPNGPGLPVWSKWDPTSRVNIVFNTTVVNEAYKDACDMWDTIGYYH